MSRKRNRTIDGYWLIKKQGRPSNYSNTVS